MNNSEGGKALRCNERTTREEGKRTAFVLLDVLARSKRTTFAPREITAQFQTPVTNFACIVEQRKFVWILTLEDVFAIGIISKPCHCLVRSRFVRTKIEFITTIPIQDFPPVSTVLHVFFLITAPPSVPLHPNTCCVVQMECGFELVELDFKYISCVLCDFEQMIDTSS